MGMKEAAKTSIISKRWRYVSTKATHLDFNPSIIFPYFNLKHSDRCFSSRAIKKKYINWVNQVVNLHSSPCIDKFTACFGFERRKMDARHIDKWVRFAISKQVKNIELSCVRLRNSFYTLRFDDIIDSSSSGIRFLQSLCLKSINVSGDILEYVLEQCRFLERLHIEVSPTLVKLKVVGLCLKLKHLTISDCFSLKQLEIEAVNLVYLQFDTFEKDHWSNVVFKNTPNLVDASFAASRVSYFTPIFLQNSHLAQISRLSLRMQLDVLSAGSLPTFCNLKQLTIMVDYWFEDELIACINQFLKACPNLCQFKVEFIDLVEVSSFEEAYQLNKSDSFSDDDEEIGDYNMELDRKVHPNLREFQVSGFCGRFIDVELILFILRISCNLETIICECHHGHSVAEEVTQVIRSRADKLVKLIPPKISLVII
ncbi:F-box/FBD/LRR-repeat protein At1g13570-like [Silene latifolia]|uniref:F-box/FBD/LRR-repeat protein At1g13570-like n=1 Tax=Silene latifolia TaxID=37657 RepID=UPI003D78A93F